MTDGISPIKEEGTIQNVFYLLMIHFSIISMQWT